MLTVITIPRFKSHFSVRSAPPDLVFFLGESGYRILQGSLLSRIAPLINGTSTVAEIARQVEGSYSQFDVECGLLLLQSEGLLTDAQDSGLSHLDFLRDSWNIPPRLFARRLKTQSVRVVSAGGTPTQQLAAALKHLGVRTETRASLTVVLTDDYLHEDLHRFHQHAIRRSHPWMPVKAAGTVLWFGPVFHPPRTGCWNCLARRLKQNREAQSYLESRGEARAGHFVAPAVPGAADLAMNLAALQILKWLTAGFHEQESLPLMTLDVKSMKLEEHAAPRFPDCKACGNNRGKSKAAPRPVKLQSCKKLFTYDGGHRAASAESTFEKYRHHISPITGIVDQVELHYADPRGLAHSYVAGHLFVPPPASELFDRGLRPVSAGKGMTAQQARTGALCEALERYSGVFRGEEYTIRKSYRELGAAAIHPNHCMHFSETQLARRGRTPDPIPAPFDEKRKIDWVPVWSLTSRAFHYVPAAYCYYGFPLSADHEFCRADSNGNAAGNTLEEAILHGFMELVERDSAAIWWYNRVRRPALDLRASGLPYVDGLLDYYRELGLNVRVLDITADFPIASFAALASPARGRRPQFLLGLGAHFDPATALLRALTEMNQFLKVFLTGGSQRILKPRGSDLSFLQPDPAQPLRTLGDFPRPAGRDLRDDVTACVKLAQERGMKTLVLDQTRPDVGLPVVKVIVPGLRHLRPRFAPGRLYDVPVQLGWLKKPRTEDELNPDHIVM